MENILLTFGLTGKCNLECSYCIVRENKDRIEEDTEISPDIIRQAYTKIRNMHPTSFLEMLCLGKGEPMLNWDAIMEIDNLKERDDASFCSITTNGTLTEKTIELAKKDRWLVQVSYDGINNTKTRNNTELVETTLKELANIPDAKYLVRMTVIQEELEALKQSLDKIKSLGVRYVCLGPAVSLGKHKEVKQYTDSDFRKFFEGVFYAKKIGLNPMVSIQEPCTLATRGYYVQPHGGLSICYLQEISPSNELREKAKKDGCLLNKL